MTHALCDGEGRSIPSGYKGVLTPNLMIVSLHPPFPLQQPMRKSMLSGGSTPRGGLPAKCNRTNSFGRTPWLWRENRIKGRRGGGKDGKVGK